MSIFSALVGIGGPLLGGLFGSRGGDDAARASEAAMREAMGLIGNAGDQARTDQMPYYNAGTWSLDQMQDFLRGDTSGYEQSAPYTSGVRAGSDAIHAGATAGNNLWGGGTQADLVSFGHDYAQQYAGDHFNRLYGIGQMGAGAATNMAQIGMSTANNLADLQTGIGQTQASAHANRANQTTNALGQIMGFGSQRGWW